MRPPLSYLHQQQHSRGLSQHMAADCKLQAHQDWRPAILVFLALWACHCETPRQLRMHLGPARAFNRGEASPSSCSACKSASPGAVHAAETGAQCAAHKTAGRHSRSRLFTNFASMGVCQDRRQTLLHLASFKQPPPATPRQPACCPHQVFCALLREVASTGMR